MQLRHASPYFLQALKLLIMASLCTVRRSVKIMSIKKLLLFLILSFTASFAVADGNPGSPQKKPIRVFCPEIDQLEKDPKSNLWSTASGWRSYSPSFANKIKDFLGAQWVGTKVGNVFCIYEGEGKTFLVVLQFHGLAYGPTADPKTNSWSPNKDGRQNCVAGKISACPFTPYLKKEVSDVYQQLDTLKSDSTPEVGF